ncbi:MAG: SpoIIE family protein phosphatase [Candidatus Zixiibacteriota bacterium]|nr:MAG: SpoIIE family protein phosphatase [candidate division Zixibacteria bacterium]
MSSRNKDGDKHEWPQTKDFRRSIRVEHTVVMACMIFTLMAIAGYLVITRHVETVANHVVRELVVQARSFSRTAGELLLSSENPDQLLLGEICGNFANDNSDVYWCGISGVDSTFIAHTDIRQVMRHQKWCQVAGGRRHDVLREGEVHARKADTLYTIIPVVEEGHVLGYLVAASSDRAIREARLRAVTTMATGTGAVVIIGTILMLLALHRQLRPISQIVQGVQRIDPVRLAIEIPKMARNELGYLAATVKVMANRLREAQQELLEKQRLAQELHIANQIQHNILPKEFPKDRMFECAGIYRGAREVSGDYFDFIPLKSERLGIVVADVSGKSLPAMLIALHTRDIVRNAASWSGGEPAETLIRSNAELVEGISEGMFVTLFFGLLDVTSGRFKYASAGHTPVIKTNIHSQEMRFLKPPGPPLGLFDTDEFAEMLEEKEILLQRGDWLLFYTDGVNEAQNSAGDFYGKIRLARILETAKQAEAQKAINRIADDLTGFVGDHPQSDDITLLALHWQATCLPQPIDEGKGTTNVCTR